MQPRLLASSTAGHIAGSWTTQRSFPVISARAQDFTLPPIELHQVPLSPIPQLAKVPLKGKTII